MTRYDTGHGSAIQIVAADSLIVRSLEIFPEPAPFRLALCAHLLLTRPAPPPAVLLGYSVAAVSKAVMAL